MKLNFYGSIDELKIGIEIFSRELGFSISPEGTNVQVEENSEGMLSIIKSGNNIVIRYSKKIHFFRALGLLVEAMRKNDRQDFEITEVPQFTMNGVMFDVSQGNAVINVENVKRLLTKMAVMGLDMIMLYLEDSYVIKDEPYFGYMRGRYTYDELRECDDFADIFGIEMIPCIQTLAHLIDVLKWDCYSDIKEDNDTLLVGFDRTYEFIEKMIAEGSAPFRSKRIHIGMDEAWKLGQGKYLLENGYRRKFDIITEHLGKVLEITQKFGLKPMIWSDMYFRAGSKTGHDYYSRDIIIAEEVLNRFPQGVQLIYWDYYHHEEDFYIEWIEKHRKFAPDPIFAGGIWSWTGFGANYDKTFATTNTALEACKKEGVKEVFATVWGDAGTESNVYSNLLGMQLYAEHGYSRMVDMEKLKNRFKFCTGGNYDDFRDITYLDKLPGTDTQNRYNFTVCKSLMWQDILIGLFDKNIEGFELNKHYSVLGTKMSTCVERNGEYGFLFSFYEKVCAVLEIKAEMSLKISKAYKNGCRDVLLYIAEVELPELAKRIENLRDYHMKLWMKVNKPFGWEVLDIRYGGVLARISSAEKRLKEFLEGRIDRLGELEEEKLLFKKNPEPGLPSCNLYGRMVSTSRLS